MADAVASAVVKVVAQKIATIITDEFAQLYGVHEELENLRSTMSTVYAVLQDAEEREMKDKAMCDWIKKLKDAAYDADDVLDEFSLVTLRRKLGANDGMVRRVSNFFLQSNPIVHRYKLGNRIKQVGKRLDAVSSERTKFHMKEQAVSDRRLEFNNRVTVSAVDELQVYGRDEDRERMIRLLIETEVEEDPYVIPICGMGGLGKTTLGQLAFNDERTKRHFELRIWICVSENFDLKRIIRALVESSTGDKCDFFELETMHYRVHEVLNEKRFLLVLDDVWNEDEEKWDRLKVLLRGGRKGSRIIVTTRNEKVASIMGPTRPYHLGVLSDDDCWNLFKQRAFGIGGNEQQAPSFVAIGKEIVNKCGGIPLAAKALGSLMRFKRDTCDWLAVRDSEIWELPEDENGVLSALSLSYSHLPSHLKQCLVYCSLFPKDHDFDKEKLIMLWIAEGLIPSDGSYPAEDIGNEFFTNLMARSFFQYVENTHHSPKVTYRMHDLIHDLIQSVSGDEFMTMGGRKTAITAGDCRYLSLVGNEMLSFPDVCKYKKLRALLSLSRLEGIRYVPEKLFISLTSLRTLDISQSSITVLPVYISKLKHLRYLDLSQTKIETLPRSIGGLLNLRIIKLSYCSKLQSLPQSLCRLIYLETLDLENCIRVRELPANLKAMKNLTHLRVSGCDSLICFPEGIGQLIKLQTLPRFFDSNHGASIMELQNLNLLRGGLHICNLENLRNINDVKQAKLKKKQKLQSLVLSWKCPQSEEHMDEAVLEALHPHRNLEKLELDGYRSTKFPGWLVSGIEILLPNLVQVTLSNINSCKQLPPLGQLPLLKVLEIEKMPAVTYVGKEFYGTGSTTCTIFPCLEILSFSFMPNLEEWLVPEDNSGNEVLPCLTKLVVIACPKLKPQPCLPVSVVHMKVIDSNIELILKASSNLEREELQSFESLRRPSLRELDIWNCEASSGWKGLQYLTDLEDLFLCNCKEMTSVPQSIRHLVSLRRLYLYGCINLSTLPEWLEELRLLEVLDICRCPRLVSLPQGLQNHTALQFLNIINCPLLERKCEKDVGED
ncbi:disease resistance protein RGA2-like [Typha latifolia]|uniref:disease resistance protein RGA2-like n=1 Tax=Typha latifolia TaxID=4733 RepID=UPI003C2F75D8